MPDAVSSSPTRFAGLIPVQLLYRPSDAARVCGISVDRVTGSIQRRPNLFPVRRWARRHEWDAAEFARVVASLYALSPRARNHIEKQLAAL